MSLVLIAVGAFLIVLGPMIRWYAYPRLAVAPVNQRSVTGLEAKGATIFDPTTLKEIKTDLTITVRTTGDASTPKKHPGSVTYVNTTVTKDAAGTMVADNGKIRGEVERMTFDARTGEATPNVSDDFVSDTEGFEQKVVHQGLVAKFPFQTKKQTYQFWDATLGKTVPIEYQGTSTIEGLTVYKFTQTIPPTQYGEMEVPLSVLGLEGDETVTAQEMYSNQRTLMVEPETGVIITRTEAQHNTLAYQGEDRVTLTDAVVNYDSETVRKNIDDYGSQGSMLHLVRAVVPQIAFVLGLVMLIGGVVLGRRRAVVGGHRVRELQDAAH
jgi:hypothetical protein